MTPERVIQLLTLDEFPLHGPGPIGPHRWWLCSEPERPMDQWVEVDWRCSGCRLKIRVELNRGHDPLVDFYMGDTIQVGFVFRLSEALDLVEDHLAEEGVL